MYNCRTIALSSLAAALFTYIPAAMAQNTTITRKVDCSKNNQSISKALETVDGDKHYVIEVSGTCTENVRVVDFEGLSLQINGTPTATINGVSATPQPPLIQISSSRRVLLSNLTLNPVPFTASASQAGLSISQCRGCATNMVSVNGDRIGIVLNETEMVLQETTINLAGPGTALAVTGSSDVNLVNYSATGSTSPLSATGLIATSASRVRLNYNTPKTIRNFINGILVNNGASVEGPSTCGAPGSPTACLTIRDSTTGLRVTGGQVSALSGVIFDDNADGIWVENGSVVTLGPLVNITDSTGAGPAVGNGITITHNSHVSLSSFVPALPANSITSNFMRGVAVASSSSLQLNGLAGSGQNAIVGNDSGTDIACDATSLVTGTSTVPVGAVVACANQNPAPIPLP